MIMVGRVTVLFALLAQGMAITSSMSFVHCLRADGEQRLELATIGCRCCGCGSDEHQHESCESHEDHHHQHRGKRCPQPSSPPIPELTCLRVCCVHSAVEQAPQLRNRITSDLSVLWPSMTIALSPAHVEAIRRSSHDFRPLLQPAESPHLIAASVIVLRV